MKKGGKRFFIPVLFMLISVALFLYAPISQYLDERIQLTSFIEYSDRADQVDEALYEAEWQKAVDYNNSLLGDPVKDPFIYGTGVAVPKNYSEVMNINGTMGYIDIPKISVLLPIYHGTSEEVLQKGAGHLQQTFMPIGGEGTHCVISAHTGLPNAMMFDNLTSLNIGDRFYLHVLNRTLAYEVDEINVVLPYEFGELLNPVPGEDHVTMITCTPFGVNSHRLLVRGSRIEDDDEIIAKMAENDRKSVAASSAEVKLLSRAVFALVTVVFVAALLIVLPKALSAEKGKEKKQKFRKT